MTCLDCIHRTECAGLMAVDVVELAQEIMQGETCREFEGVGE